MAIRLSPSDPSMGIWTLVFAVSSLYSKNYQDALDFARKSLRTFDTWNAWMLSVSALGHLGDRSAARAFHDLSESGLGFP